MNSGFISEAGVDWPSFPAIGVGCATIGNLYAAVSDADADAMLTAAVASGARYFDTAPYYGHGLSEERLGNFLRRMPGDFIVSSKVGRSLAPDEAASDTGFVGARNARPYFDYSRSAVEAQLDASLERLGRSTLDIAFVHDLGAMVHGASHPQRLREALDGAFPALDALRAQGQVGAIGLGVNEVPICLDVLAAVDLDVILLAGRYTLLEQDPLDELLPLCTERGTRVVIGGPFNSGVLAGGTHYNYGVVPPVVRDRVRALTAVCAQFGVPLPAAALQFPLAHPAVASVVPGARSATEVRTNLAWLDVAIPAELWSTCKEQGLLRADAPVPAGQ